MDNESMNIMVWGVVAALVVFGVGFAIAPLVKLLDRISAVVAGLDPVPGDFLALKIYWYLARNQDVLRELEEKNAKGEKTQIVFPI